MGAARVTHGWRQRKDVDAVELIHWDVAQPAASVLPGLTAHHAIPLANLRARSRAHALAPFAALDGALEGICGEHPFDVVVNLSYSRFAGYIAPVLAGGQQHAVHGAVVDDTGRWRCSHPALEYLGGWGLDPALNVFAHQDLWALSSRVRLGASGQLPPDPVADNLAAHARANDAQAPILVAPGVAVAGDDGFGWDEFITRCKARTGRPVVLVSEPGHASFSDALARTTGCEVANWPVRHSAALLRRAAGLVGVPGGLSQLAGNVGTPQVLLCPDSQAPLEALSADSLCVCPREGQPTTEEVIALVEAHFLEEQVPSAAFVSAARRVILREVVREESSALGSVIPSWWNASAEDRAQDREQRAWRTAWLTSWMGGAPPHAALRDLAHTDSARMDRARHDRGRLGTWIRDEEQRTGSAASERVA